MAESVAKNAERRQRAAGKSTTLSDSSAMNTVVVSMDTIVNSPYQGNFSAEVGEHLFEATESLMGPEQSSSIQLPSKEAIELFGEKEAETITEMSKAISVSGMLYGCDWSKGFIRGKWYGVIPTNLLLVLLRDHRIARANITLLKLIAKDLKVWPICCLALSSWSLSELYPILAQCNQKFILKLKQRQFFHCMFFLARAATCMQILGVDSFGVGKDSKLHSKIHVCLAIMEKEIDAEIVRANSRKRKAAPVRPPSPVRSSCSNDNNDDNRKRRSVVTISNTAMPMRNSAIPNFSGNYRRTGMQNHLPQIPSGGEHSCQLPKNNTDTHDNPILSRVSSNEKIALDNTDRAADPIRYPAIPNFSGHYSTTGIQNRSPQNNSGGEHSCQPPKNNTDMHGNPILSRVSSNEKIATDDTDHEADLMRYPAIPNFSGHYSTTGIQNRSPQNHSGGEHSCQPPKNNTDMHDNPILSRVSSKEKIASDDTDCVADPIRYPEIPNFSGHNSTTGIQNRSPQNHSGGEHSCQPPKNNTETHDNPILSGVSQNKQIASDDTDRAADLSHRLRSYGARIKSIYIHRKGEKGPNRSRANGTTADCLQKPSPRKDVSRSVSNDFQKPSPRKHVSRSVSNDFQKPSPRKHVSRSVSNNFRSPGRLREERAPPRFSDDLLHNGKRGGSHPTGRYHSERPAGVDPSSESTPSCCSETTATSGCASTDPDYWFPRDPEEVILNETEIETAWLVEESLYCNRTSVIDWDFVMIYASPALRVVLQRSTFHDDRSFLGTVLRSEWSARRFEVVRRTIRRDLVRNVVRKRMRTILPRLRYKTHPLRLKKLREAMERKAAGR